MQVGRAFERSAVADKTLPQQRTGSRSEVLSRFASHLIDFPQATDDFRFGVREHSRETALLRRYVALNHRLAFYVAIDIDRQGAAFAWEEGGLPPPTITTINPSNAHAHLLWELAAPVATTPKGRRKPIDYLNATASALRDRVRGDIGYARYLTKNPLHPSWKVITCDRTYDLVEFQEYIDLAPSSATAVEENLLSRNCTLFDTLRRWAYRNVASAQSFEHWQWQCEQVAEDFNAFDEPLRQYEVRGIARSVARWTWKRQNCLKKPNEGILNLPPLPVGTDPETRAMEVCARQSAGARYTHGRQRTRTARAIEEAACFLGLDIGTLRDRDASRLAIRARLGINTVRRFIAERAA